MDAMDYNTIFFCASQLISNALPHFPYTDLCFQMLQKGDHGTTLRNRLRSLHPSPAAQRHPRSFRWCRSGTTKNLPLTFNLVQKNGAGQPFNNCIIHVRLDSYPIHLCAFNAFNGSVTALPGHNNPRPEHPSGRSIHACGYGNDRDAQRTGLALFAGSNCNSLFPISKSLPPIPL